ncbi:ABC transporter substrate-binding protein [Vineibacter terrae]|uniref:ABC transporter substrate-binding protein n=1 Tax=Vineibacter terrae TaxID=2586908 RepID=UPI002E32B773|nr:ABC transporter substrate-binding protein [Vineibacter terrae]HEX2891177.1 ABC transporter substrate-binding protein [Vineibacter terrae]
MKLTRRILVRSAAASALAIGAPAIVRNPAAAADELVFVGFGGAYQEGQKKALFEPFERETGIKIVQTTGVELAKLKAQVQSRNIEWDLICLPDRLRYTAQQDGLLEKLDYSRLDTADILAETVSEYCVGAITFCTQLTYNKQALPAGVTPAGWADFWNTAKIPGRRGLFSGPVNMLEFALLADGVAKDKLYPLDVARALKSLGKLKANGVWWTQFPQAGQMLQSKEVAMTPWTRGPGLILEGQPIGVSFDGAAISYEGWVVPKGTKKFDAAMKFIAFALQPARQAELTKHVVFGPTNKKAFPLVDPKVAALLPSNPENFRQGFLLNGDWWGPNLTKVTEQFNEWRLT